MTVWIFLAPKKAVPVLVPAAGQMLSPEGQQRGEERPARAQSGRPLQIRGRWAEGRSGWERSVPFFWRLLNVGWPA